MTRSEKCTISKASAYKEGRGFWTCVVTTVEIEYGCATQGFGCLVFDNKEQCDDFVSDLCAVFEVEKLDDLVGMECARLYCFGYHNETIEALEAPNGKRFTLTEWRRKHYPHSNSPYENERERLEGDCRRAVERWKRAEKELETLDERYVSISDLPRVFE